MDRSSVLLIRGVVGIAVGLLAMLWPALTVTFLVVLFAAYALVDGLANLVLGIRRTRGERPDWASILEGVVGIAAGVLTFIWPGITAIVLLAWVAAWAIITGVLELVAAVRLRREIRGEWLLALSGVASIVLGVVLLALPTVGMLALAWALGAYAAASGIILVALGIRLRSRLIGA